jgi:hypothetical protein
MLGIDPGMMARAVYRGIEPGLSALRAAVAPGLDVDGIRAIFDEAEQGQTDGLFRMYADMIFSDTDLIAGLTQRKAGFISKPWNFEMPKGASRELKANTEFLKPLQDHAGFQQLLPHLPTGGLWPVAVAKQSYKPGTRGNFYDLDRITLKTWQVLDFTGGLGAKPAGTLGIKCLTKEGQFTGSVEFPECCKGEPELGWIVHRGNVLADFPDAWGGPLRAAAMWWFFGIQVRTLWVNYAEHGSYLLVGKHDANDTEGRDLILSAFDEAKRTTGIAVSTETDVEVHNLASQGGAEVYAKLIKYCSDQVLKVILGSTMTVNASANGFGGNQSAVQQESTGDIFLMDAVFAERTIKAQVFAPLLKLNGLDATQMPGISWGGKTEDKGALAELVAKLKTGGLRPADSALAGLSERFEFEVEREETTPAANDGPGLPGGPGFSGEVDGEEPGAKKKGPRTFAIPVIAPSRRKMLAAALRAGEEIDREAAAVMARAGRGQFAALDFALRHANTAEEALAVADSWLETFSVDPLAGALEDACSAHAANGCLKSAAVGGLPP